MSLRVIFDLSDRDLHHFREMMDKCRETARTMTDQEIIRTTTHNVLEEARKSELPDFIAERLDKLEMLTSMVTDEEWQLPDEDRERILGAIAYFADPEDLIPDRIPGLGFLDDAILVALVVRDLKHEIEAYEDFCHFRKAEEKRRSVAGTSTKVRRDDWLTERRAVLHSRMRRRRRAEGPRWRIASW